MPLMGAPVIGAGGQQISSPCSRLVIVPIPGITVLAAVVERRGLEVGGERSSARRRVANRGDDLKRIGRVGSQGTAWSHGETDESGQSQDKD